MTQSEIIGSLADSTGLKKTDVKGFFDALASLATSEVKRMANSPYQASVS
jgi:nucleoid DNA-binding protein